MYLTLHVKYRYTDSFLTIYRVSGEQGNAFEIVALAQKAEYIWMDGQEGSKGVRFNEMRSKTKVIQNPIKIGSTDFPEWSFDGSRYVCL